MPHPTTKEFLIPLRDKLTLGAIEESLSANYQASLKAGKVTFNAQDLEFIGHFPASLLYSWCRHLSKLGKRIKVQVAPWTDLNPQVHKAFLSCELLLRLHECGVEVDYHDQATLTAGIPLQQIDKQEKLWGFLRSTSTNLLKSKILSDEDSEVVLDALDVVLFELAENSFTHTVDRPHLQMTLSQAVGGGASEGIIAQYPASVKYVEICLGDLGEGIDSRLEAHVPKDYNPIFCPPRASAAQRAISYSFEFSSTSNREGRRQRISDLLRDAPVPPEDVASGLFNVLEVVRERLGQLVVRTSNAIVAIDYSSGKITPIIRGSKNLIRRSLGGMPGTHFLVRLPLNHPKRVVSTRSAFAIPFTTKDAEVTIEDVTILPAFRNARETDAPAETIHRAVALVDAHLNATRSKAGLVVVMPAPVTFHSRAIAVFLAVLRAIPHGKKTIFWNDTRAQHAVLANPSPTVDATRRVKTGGQCLLIGDLVSNAVFVAPSNKDVVIDGINVVPNEAGKYVLPDSVYRVINRKYAEALHNDLVKALSANEVRHAPGPFLISNKYYRNVFYEFPRALADHATKHFLAEWVFRELYKTYDDLPQVLIGTSHILKPLLTEIGRMLLRAADHHADIVCREQTSQSLWALKNLGAYCDKKSVLITDIVSSGKTLEDELRLMAGLNVGIVFALVDARTDHNGEPVVVHGVDARSVPLKAVVSEPIPTYTELPPRGVSNAGDERVYLIDPDTRAPTLHIRHSAPQASLLNLLSTVVRRSESLICGHIEFDSKHYSDYLHFPKLFGALREEIEKWIGHQIESVAVEVSNQKTKGWRAGIYDPDGSMSWLPTFLELLPQKPIVEEITGKQLFAPPPQKETSDHWVVIIPAIASGDTARRIAEYAARFSPKSIILLCIVSRAAPPDLAFMAQIRRYGDAAFRFGVLYDFPLTASSPHGGSCAVCQAHKESQRVKELIEHSGENSTRIQKLIEERLAETRLVRLDSMPLEESTPPVSDGDISRLQIHSSYIAAKYDLNRADEFISQLKTDPTSIDYWFEVVGRHRHGVEFSEAAIEMRLSRIADAIRDRALQIVRSEKPPFPVGRVIGGIAHLYRGLFLERASDLMKRYSNSIRDLEEIVFELIRFGVMPTAAAEMIETFGKVESQEARELVEEAISVIRSLETPDERRDEEQVRHLCELSAKLIRSSFFAHTLPTLIDRGNDSSCSVSQLIDAASHLVHHWRMEVLPPLVALRQTPIWRLLSTPDGDSSEPMQIELLEGCISRVVALSKSTPMSIRNEPEFRRHLRELGVMIQTQVNYLYSRVSGHFVNVLSSSYLELPKEIEDTSGRRIPVTTEIDRGIDQAFCNLSELDFVVSELIANWREHSGISTHPEVWLKVYQDKSHVILEFGDTFGGEFDEHSWGGIHTAREFCRRYCAQLRLTKPDGENKKAVQLMLRRYTHPIW